MKKRARTKALRKLEESRSSGELVRIVTSPCKRRKYHKGFIVGLSGEWILLHSLKLDPFVLNGYECVRLKDVRTIERIGRPERFEARAALLRGLEAVPPESIDLSSTAALLASITETYPVVSLAFDGVDDGGWYCGRVVDVRKKRFSMRMLGRDAEWTEVFRYPLGEITQIDFDGGYERMLWQVNQAFHNTLLAHTPDVGTA